MTSEESSTQVIRTIYGEEKHKHSQIMTESQKKARPTGMEGHEAEKIINEQESNE